LKIRLKHGFGLEICYNQSMEENRLDNLIICHKCHTLHIKKPLKEGEKAFCKKCGAVLYRSHKNLLSQIIALSIAAVLFFLIFLFFPLVTIDISTSQNRLSAYELVIELFKNRFLIVGTFVTLSVIIFPLFVHILYLITALFLKTNRNKKTSKNLLKILSHLLPWSMSDIFLISFFVAMVKLIGYATIHFGVALFALAAFVMIDIYLTRYIGIRELWDMRDRLVKK